MQKDEKNAIIAKYQLHDKDTGSAQVQIAILTAKIQHLTEHLKVHKKDKHSRRGLIGMVGDRRKLLRFLQMDNPDAYKKLIADLGLRK
jgi:small subunit ribosomal protein S15